MHAYSTGHSVEDKTQCSTTPAYLTIRLKARLHPTEGSSHAVLFKGHHGFFKREVSGVREMAQQLNALAALAGTWVWFPGVTRQLTMVYS